MHPAVKPLVFLLALVPLGLLVWDGFTGGLGANPVEVITHRTGDWALHFLLITLAVTPLRRLSGWNWLVRLRRMLGLYAFFYAVLHVLTYVVFDHFFDLLEIGKDIVKRPYITLGFSAFVLMVPLAITSTNAMMRRLGRRWTQLHQLIYPLAVAAIIHYMWLVKADYLKPTVYAAILLLLLLARAVHQRRSASRAQA